jgi:hypothetical protein
MDSGKEEIGNSDGFFSGLMQEHRRLRDEARRSVFMCTIGTGGEATGNVAVLCKDLAEAIMHCNCLEETTRAISVNGYHSTPSGVVSGWRNKISM